MVPIIPPAKAHVPNMPNIEFLTESENHPRTPLVTLGQHWD